MSPDGKELTRFISDSFSGVCLTYLVLIGLDLGTHGSKVHSRHWKLSSKALNAKDLPQIETSEKKERRPP